MNKLVSILTIVFLTIIMAVPAIAYTEMPDWRKEQQTWNSWLQYQWDHGGFPFNFRSLFPLTIVQSIEGVDIDVETWHSAGEGGTTAKCEFDACVINLYRWDSIQSKAVYHSCLIYGRRDKEDLACRAYSTRDIPIPSGYGYDLYGNNADPKDNVCLCGMFTDVPYNNGGCVIEGGEYQRKRTRICPDNCDIEVGYRYDANCIPTVVDKLPTCSDGIMNQGETNIDCGGTNCRACSSPVIHCENTLRDRDEIGVDCGGADCVACGPAQDVKCGNGVKDAGETCKTCADDIPAEECVKEQITNWVFWIALGAVVLLIFIFAIVAVVRK